MILKTIISNVENELDKKEHYWINNSLTLEDKSRGAVHRLHMTEKWCACSAPSVYL